MIKVVVAITTYNLEKYIAQAIDSVLVQKTNFDYKIIIADDCSADDTVTIIQRYASKYPDKIKLLLSEKNQGSLVNSNRIFDGLQCEYFAFLDGDDYWVGEEHLQKQVDFLDSHPEYMLCGGNTQYFRNGELAEYVIEPKKCAHAYSFLDMLNGTIPFVHTSALLVRNCIFDKGLPQCYKDAEDTFENCALRGEDFRRILHLEQGLLYVMPEIVSVYRIHEMGVWQGSSLTKRAIENAIGWNFYKKYFAGKYGDFFEKMALDSYRNMLRVLVTERNFLSDYELNEKETYLLTGLLSDLKKNNFKTAKKSAFSKRVLLCIMRLLF